jgi:hypothetical protein
MSVAASDESARARRRTGPGGKTGVPDHELSIATNVRVGKYKS